MIVQRRSYPSSTVASIVGCPFQTTEQIAGLAPRGAPYWHHLLVGRHIGVHRPDLRLCNWTARLLTRDGRYVQKCLGPALPISGSAIRYEDAVDAAFDWFKIWQDRSEASEASPKGRTDRLRFCPIGEVYTVGHALCDYLDWAKIARSTGGHYNMVVLANHHLTNGVTHISLEAFQAKDLQTVALDIIRTPPRFGFSKRQAALVDRAQLSPDELRRRKRTYNSVASILKMAFSHAWENGKVSSERPARCVKRVSVVHTPRLLFLDRMECRLLLQHCTAALRDLVLAALYTGCRVGELASLRVEDIGEQIYGLRISAFKRSPARFVFLPDEGMAFFLRQAEGKLPKDFVLRSDKGKLWRRQHANLFRRAVTRAGLPREFVFHGLRHTYASDLIQQGVPLDVVARQLGHADIRTVSQTYGHMAEQFREEQVRTRFTPLDDDECRQAGSRSGELETLWRQVHGDDWRQYALPEPSGQRCRQALVRTPKEVLAVFEL